MQPTFVTNALCGQPVKFIMNRRKRSWKDGRCILILLNLQAVYVPQLWGSLIKLLCKPLLEVIFISEISFKRAVIKRGKQTKKRNTRNTHLRENLALLSTRFNVMVLAQCRYNGGLSQRV